VKEAVIRVKKRKKDSKEGSILPKVVLSSSLSTRKREEGRKGGREGEKGRGR